MLFIIILIYDPNLPFLQSVADRDFVAEYLFVCSLLMVHISRLAEDIIIYSSSEFGWVMCGDAYSWVAVSLQLAETASS